MTKSNECIYCGDNKFQDIGKHLKEMEDYFGKIAVDLMHIMDDCNDSALGDIASAYNSEILIKETKREMIQRIANVLWFHDGRVRHYTAEALYEHFKKEFPEINAA